VGAPGHTLLFTAVVTSSAENAGDFPKLSWTADGGSFVETNKQTVRWVAPANSGVFTVTAKATNTVNSASNTATVFVGGGQVLVPSDGGQVNLIGTGPDFHYLRSPLIDFGYDVNKYIAGVASDATPPGFANGQNLTYSADGSMEAHAADTLLAGATVRPRYIYVSDFASGTFRRLGFDGTKPGNLKHNQYNHPAFSPNGQVVAYQRLAQSWTASGPDSFLIYISDLVANTRTLVTYDHQYPRTFFPAFSTDGKWLTYLVDKNRSGTYDLYGSPMTGNTVDGAEASLVKMTSGIGIVSGAAGSFQKPLMTWNPVAPILALAAADNTLYLIQTTATGSNIIPVNEVPKAQELLWAADGSMLAAVYAKTIGDDSHSTIATISPAGVVTDRVSAPVGDGVRDVSFSPDLKWMLYRVTRGGGSWFSVADLSAGKLSEPVPVTPTTPAGGSGKYRGFMSLRSAWTSNNLMIYPAWTGDDTPAILSRDLSGLLD
jgi:hypothetical protein